MGTVLRTSLDQIVLKVRDRLVFVLGWPEERILVAHPDMIPDHSQADQYLCLWCDQERPLQPIIDGAGRIDARLACALWVTLRTRYSVDDATSGLAWLTAASLGHLRARHLLWDALLNFQPAQPNGDWLVCQPLVPLPANRPGPRRHNDRWGESSLRMDAIYELDLTITGVEVYL